MPVSLSSEYVAKLKAAGHPVIVSGNQIISGRVILTVEPSLENESGLQIQVPANFDLNENLCLPLLLILIFQTAEVWWPLWLRISTAISATGSFSEEVLGWKTTASAAGGDLVLTFSK